MRVLVVICCAMACLTVRGNGVIPEPAAVMYGDGVLCKSTLRHVTISNDSLIDQIQFLGQDLRLKVGRGTRDAINLAIDKSIENAQGYRLQVNKTGVNIVASTRQGLFYGIMTLNQLSEDQPTINYVTITDEPTYDYRALMIDPARHFLPLDGVKRYIELMARYKFNTLHIHLSDDQGWRVEIKNYPLLTSIGSVRMETESDGTPHKGYYTQDELRDLVAYAARYYVQIIPEIDVPGHSVAAIAAYPWLTCRDTTLEVRTTIGVSRDLLCAGNERVMQMYDTIFNEICDIFPSRRIHIGGDEAPTTNWDSCVKCLAAKDSLRLGSNQELMSRFFDRIARTLHARGREPMLWYETDIPSYPAGSTMYAWRHGLSAQVKQECFDKGYNVVCSPGEYAYLDYPQFEGEITAKSSSWMSIILMENIYRKFDPRGGLVSEQSAHIIGVEATIWGEYVPDIETLFKRTYPRAFAIAEVGWGSMSKRNWDDFLVRARREAQYMNKMGVRLTEF